MTGGGLWEGAASSSFGDYWAGVQGEVDELATRHGQMADRLDGIAGRAEGLNRRAAAAIGRLDAWLGTALAAIAALDVAAAAGLLAEAATLLTTWSDLLAELEAFASGLPGELGIDLTLTLPTPWPAPIGGDRPPGVPLPGLPLPGLPGTLITTPGPKGPEILITTPGPKGPEILITTPGPKGPGILITTPGPKGPDILITTPAPKGPSVVTSKPTGGKGEPGSGQGRGERVPPPRDLPAFPGATRVKPKTPVQGGGGLRARWKGRDGTIYEWDSQHGKVEVYDKRGRSQGEFDPVTGQQTKPPDPARRVEP